MCVCVCVWVGGLRHVGARIVFEYVYQGLAGRRAGVPVQMQISSRTLLEGLTLTAQSPYTSTCSAGGGHVIAPIRPSVSADVRPASTGSIPSAPLHCKACGVQPGKTLQNGKGARGMRGVKFPPCLAGT